MWLACSIHFCNGLYRSLMVPIHYVFFKNNVCETRFVKQFFSQIFNRYTTDTLFRK